MKRIYQKIAKENGISVSDVKREMQAAIDSAYKNVRKSQTEKELLENITYQGDIPTVEEFIESISSKYKCQIRK
ncbi:sporulation initiation factor Spo0A C-terminal domain-containing protein [Anaerotignum sp.]|uniref:sporulation initiation factor Spo0A C-terminal domain-containing protein n=1 Tax=Anaerotignum sp. TaxID=2039241 RepID=UPI00271536AB|nr:sporulation initiation factor Spo0A C-terminal domain-containing protein [Anaerotignum sp.]